MQDFWKEDRSMTGLRSCNAEKVQCRYCVFAEKEHIGRSYCQKYPDGVFKPKDVYFEDALCPEFKKGEDLFPFEIQI